MKITYDPTKNARNIAERGLSFDQVQHFNWQKALVLEDVRHPYPERRFQAISFIGERLFVVVVTSTADSLRVISLRKANSREVKRYDTFIASQP